MTETEDLLPEERRTSSAAVRESARDWWDAFVISVQFLTHVPLPAGEKVTPGTLRRSVVFYPLVGALVGIVTAGFVGVGSMIWPLWLAVAIALAAELLLTGALHEDALADFCDAFGGGWTREEIFEILNDSRIGTFGALGLMFGVGLRLAATVAVVSQQQALSFWWWGSAIVASAVVGRWVMVLAMVCVSPASGRKSLALDVSRGLTARELLLASGVAFPLIALFAVLQPVHLFLALLLLVPLVPGFFWYVRRRVGGMTGDCIGCAGYLAQIIVLLAAAMGGNYGSEIGCPN